MTADRPFFKPCPVSVLEKENSRLKKLVADQALDMLIHKEAARPHACVAQLN